MTTPAPVMTDGGLSTLNQDGSRRWLRPRPSKGRFLGRRRAVAWLLIAVFTLLPYIRINERPAVLLDVARGEFTLFGVTFLPTDTTLLAPLLIGVFVLIFLLTAVLGRVWCGWACPQTVYMEFLFRPIERLLEGDGARSGLIRNQSAARAIKHPVYLLASMFLAHTFLAYFVGVEALLQWVRRSPLEHPGPFLLMASVTGLMMFDFGYFREQMCIVACPYGRFQSVMLDRQSLVISYDQERGEPRGKARRAPKKESSCGTCDKGKSGPCNGKHNHEHEEGSTSLALRVLGVQPNLAEPRIGDCVDCRMCVNTCPTGIDIRKGLQMECIACAQCIDACDAVMAKLGRERGLIRYSTHARMSKEKTRLLRPRVLLYPVILAAVTGVFLWALLTRTPADVSLLRGPGMPFNELAGGMVSNQVKLKIVNRTRQPAAYRVDVAGCGARLDVEENPLAVPAGDARTEPGLLVAPRSSFTSGGGSCVVDVTVSDGAGFTQTIKYKLLGPVGAAQAIATEREHDDQR
jgi:polyferredoxin